MKLFIATLILLTAGTAAVLLVQKVPFAGSGKKSTAPVQTHPKKSGGHMTAPDDNENSSVRDKTVRPAAAAGAFYPADPAALRETVEQMMMSSPALGLRGTEIILAPHAGYVYSGEVAAAGFREMGAGFQRVFLIAANHNGRADFKGFSIPEVTHYRMPDGDYPLDPSADELRKHPLYKCVPEAHTMHMIEAELPFLHHLKGWENDPGFTIIPIIAGNMGPREVLSFSDLLNRYAGGDTRFVFSVDLSHFYTDAQARKLDGATVEALMSRDEEAVLACVTDGNHVLRAMLKLARSRGLEPSHLMSRNSGDVSEDKNRVVGYASIAFHQPFKLNEMEEKALLSLAHGAIKNRLEKGTDLQPDTEWQKQYPLFGIRRGVFVTLKEKGQLRGCIGEIIPSKPLYLTVIDCAVGSALRDPRFSPVSLRELPGLSLSISILDYPGRVEVKKPEEYLTLLRPGKDGVILDYKSRRSTFLPQVWEDLPDPQQFLSRLCQKQGAPADAWKDPAMKVFRYGAYVFGEKGN